MSAAEHVAMALKMLGVLEAQANDEFTADQLIAIAQVHATLAVTVTLAECALWPANPTVVRFS